MRKIYITGVSGTGKTTIASELKNRNIFAISIDEVPNLCSWTHHETKLRHGGKDTPLTKEFVNQHDWICNIEYLNELIENNNTDVVFVLGMAGNQDEFLHLFDKIFLLECSPETFSKRIDARTDNEYGKDPEIKTQILNRYKSYNEEMLKKGAILINTEKPMEEVVAEVIAKASS